MIRFATRIPRLMPYYWKLGAALCAVISTGLVTQVWFDQQLYRQGKQAYAAADCDLAIVQFDRILRGSKLLDLNRIRPRAQLKRSECAAFLLTTSEQKDAPTALLNYKDFISRHSASPLTKSVQQRATQMFQQTEATALAQPPLCNELQSFKAKQLVPQPEDRLPQLQYACGQAFMKLGNPTLAIRFYEQAQTNSQHPLMQQINLALADAKLAAAKAEANQGDYASAIQQYRQFLTDYPNYPLAATVKSALARALVAEAGSYAKQQDYDTAIRQYQEFLQDYPKHSLVAEVKAALARTLIARAKSTGTSPIPPPHLRGFTAKGSTDVVIQNASPEKIQIVFSGPEPHIAKLAPCPTCKKYVGTGPATCPAQGPVATYTLQPGQYEVLVETSDSNITPFQGNWKLGDGTLYDSCFFIVTQPSPLHNDFALPLLPQIRTSN